MNHCYRLALVILTAVMLSGCVGLTALVAAEVAVVKSIVAADVDDQAVVANQQKQHLGTATPSDASVYEYYGDAEDEVNSGNVDKNLWDKALVETGGDQNKTKARYIELRANQLYAEKAGPVSDASLDQQAAFVTPDTPIDISGTYRSDIIGSGYWSLGKRPAKKVMLKQNQDKIIGTFLGSRSGEIDGILNGDTIKFKWFVTEGPTGGESGRGEWKLTNDGVNWNGTWRSSRGAQGDWNLTKIE